jgi:hypothetical protein
VKRLWDLASAALKQKLDATASGQGFATELVRYGQENMGRPCPQAYEGQRAARKLLGREFVLFGQGVYTDFPAPAYSMNKQVDGLGVMRLVRDCYQCFYQHKTGRLMFRNLVCSCEPCLEQDFEDCQHPEYVAPFQDVVLKGAKSAEEALEEEALAGDGTYDVVDEDFVNEVEPGEIVAVRGDPTDKKNPGGVWFALVLEGVKSIQGDQFDLASKTQLYSGCRVLTAYWLDHARGRKQQGRRVFKVLDSEPVVILSHLLLEIIPFEAVLTGQKSGRPQREEKGMYSISDFDLAHAVDVAICGA